MHPSADAFCAISKSTSTRKSGIDLLSSAFLGYFTFWVLWDSAHFTASQCAVATAIVGNFGTRIFDVVRFVIFKKIGYVPPNERPSAADEESKK